MRESARATRESLGISPPHGKITTPNSAFSRARRRDLDARDRAFAAASRIRERFSRSGESAVATIRLHDEVSTNVKVVLQKSKITIS